MEVRHGSILADPMRESTNIVLRTRFSDFIEEIDQGPGKRARYLVS